jgi:hypothetical protein
MTTRTTRRTTFLPMLNRDEGAGETKETSSTTTTTPPPRRAAGRRSPPPSPLGDDGPRPRRSPVPPPPRRRRGGEEEEGAASIRPRGGGRPAVPRRSWIARAGTEVERGRAVVRPARRRRHGRPGGHPLLDDLFPGLDLLGRFCSDGSSRTAMRDAMREDVFESSLGYATMSEKARRMLLLPDSSLQGSWRRGGGRNDGAPMRRLTGMMRVHLAAARRRGPSSWRALMASADRDQPVTGSTLSGSCVPGDVPLLAPGHRPVSGGRHNDGASGLPEGERLQRVRRV